MVVKKFLIGIVLILGVCVIMFFRKTEDPNNIGIHKLEINDKKVHLAGTYLGGLHRFSGYSTETKGNKLYVKIKSSLLAKKGHFDLKIDNTNNIKEVYLTDGKTNKLIPIDN